MDYEQARLNMIEQQIRTWEVLDQNILDLIAVIHREEFIPEQHKKMAFVDTQIPLGKGQFTLAPKVEARIIQSLDLKPDDTVLEIGTGCGYLTALLAKSAGHVHSVDIFPEFTKTAETRLNKYEIANTELTTRDAVNGWDKHAPYDAIVVTGSIPALTDSFKEQLKNGGRLFITVGTSPLMQATLITRINENAWTSEILFETDIPPLVGAPKPTQFRF